MEPLTIMLIAITCFIVSFLNSLIGGGALIVIPVLIFAGLSPTAAIATNKIAALGLGFGGSAGFEKDKKLDHKFGRSFMALVSLGAIMGSLIIISISEEIVEKIIGILMIAITLLLIFENKIRLKRLKIRNKRLFAAFSLASGVYYGFYGAGIGIIHRFILYTFFSFDMLRSAALSVFVNIGAGLISLALFSYYGFVEYSLFLPIFAASLIGAYLGARFVTKIGNKRIKRLLAIASFAMAIKLLFF